MFDIGARMDRLRCQETERVRARRAEAIRVQRKWRLEELACTAVLDERRKVDEKTVVREGASVSAAHETLETARALGSLPRIAAAAAAGRLSDEQLVLVVQLADASTDREWAERAPTMTVAELARAVRTREKPTAADAQARRDARHLRTWWSDATGMLHLRGALADADGAAFERTVKALAEKLRPERGRPWDSFEHRCADALVQLCDHATRTTAAGPGEPLLAPRPLFVAEVPLSGPATIAGIPVADSVVEQWRAGADVEPHLVDGGGRVVKIGRRTAAVSPKLLRLLLLRDEACRICGRRHGLHAHHLRPRSWGGSDDAANMAMVCARGPEACHPMLFPHGAYALVGDPGVPGGLRMVHVDDLTDAEADKIGLPHELRRKRKVNEARAGPGAA